MNYVRCPGLSMKILIVDDNATIRRLIRHAVREIAEEIRECTDGNLALSAYADFQPDIVLLDVNVGPQDGRVMCRAIKAHAEYQHIPIILISANPEGLLSYQDYGAHAALEKPFNIPALLNLLQCAIPPGK